MKFLLLLFIVFGIGVGSGLLTYNFGLAVNKDSYWHFYVWTFGASISLLSALLLWNLVKAVYKKEEEYHKKL